MGEDAVGEERRWDVVSTFMGCSTWHQCFVCPMLSSEMDSEALRIWNGCKLERMSQWASPGLTTQT